MKIAIVLEERKEIMKIYFRSKGTGNAVNALAKEYFNCSGHANASRGMRDLTQIESLEKLKEFSPQYFNKELNIHRDPFYVNGKALL
jgi:hypothetical protein